MPLVMRGIVDEDLDRPVRLARLRDAGAQRGDVGQVDMLEMRGETLTATAPAPAVAGLVA